MLERAAEEQIRIDALEREKEQAKRLKTRNKVKMVIVQYIQCI